MNLSIFSRTLIFVIGTSMFALIVLIFLTVNFSKSYINENLNERIEALVRSQEIKVEQSLDNLGELAFSVANNSQLGVSVANFINDESPENFVAIRKLLNDLMESSGMLVKIDILAKDGKVISSLGELNNLVKGEDLIVKSNKANYGFHRISKSFVGKTYLHVKEPIFVNAQLIAEIDIVIDMTSSIETFYDNAGFGDDGFTQVYTVSQSGKWIALSDLAVVEDLKPSILINQVKYDGFLSNILNTRQPLITIEKQIPGRALVVSVNIASAEVFNAIDTFYLYLFSAFVLVMLVTLFIGFTFSRQITKPITYLNNKVSEIATGKKNIEIDYHHKDPSEIKTLSYNIEIMAKNLWHMNQGLEDIVNERTAQLTKLNESLELTVADRTKEYQEANSSLLQALEELHDTKNELVKSEKMASLGELVAGVAHEINTPLGVAVTGVSQALSQLKQLEKLKNTGTLTATSFDTYITESNKLLLLMTDQLNVASSLIKNFKEVAVDQNNFDIRTLNLYEYLDKIFDTVRPKYRPTKVDLKLNCPTDINISTRPGAFSQVISNLLINALIHGYEQGDVGCVEVRCKELEDILIIKVIDDGKGIKPEYLARVFDPFYTTKRGQGGSGLGLSIVYNIVNEALKGKITVKSTEKKGSQFIIEIPKQIEGDKV